MQVQTLDHPYTAKYEQEHRHNESPPVTMTLDQKDRKKLENRLWSFKEESRRMAIKKDTIDASLIPPELLLTGSSSSDSTSSSYVKINPQSHRDR